MHPMILFVNLHRRGSRISWTIFRLQRMQRNAASIQATPRIYGDRSGSSGLRIIPLGQGARPNVLCCQGNSLPW